MLKHRAIRLSIRDRIRDMFLSPDAGSGLASFNVYTEAQLRAASAGNFTPVFPYVYLLDAYVLPMTQRVNVMQPQVVIEIQEYRKRPFEMGNREGRWITAWVHVFGLDRGQRDDLGSFIVDYLGSSLPIKSYSASDTAGTIVETALIDPDRVVSDQFTSRLDQALDGVTLGWSLVEFKLLPKL